MEEERVFLSSSQAMNHNIDMYPSIPRLICEEYLGKKQESGFNFIVWITPHLKACFPDKMSNPPSPLVIENMYLRVRRDGKAARALCEMLTALDAANYAYLKTLRAPSYGSGIHPLLLIGLLFKTSKTHPACHVILRDAAKGDFVKLQQARVSELAPPEQLLRGVWESATAEKFERFSTFTIDWCLNGCYPVEDAQRLRVICNPASGPMDQWKKKRKAVIDDDTSSDDDDDGSVASSSDEDSSDVTVRKEKKARKKPTDGKSEKKKKKEGKPAKKKKKDGREKKHKKPTVQLPAEPSAAKPIVQPQAAPSAAKPIIRPPAPPPATPIPAIQLPKFVPGLVMAPQRGLSQEAEQESKRLLRVDPASLTFAQCRHLMRLAQLRMRAMNPEAYAAAIQTMWLREVDIRPLPVQQRDAAMRQIMLTQALAPEDRSEFNSLLHSIKEYLPSMGADDFTRDGDFHRSKNEFQYVRGYYHLPSAYLKLLPDHPLWNVPNKHALGQVCEAFSHLGLLVAFFLSMMSHPETVIAEPDPCLYKRAILVLRNMCGGILRMVYRYRWAFISSGGLYDVHAKRFAPLWDHVVFKKHASETLKLAYTGSMSEADVMDFTYGVANRTVWRNLRTHSHFVTLTQLDEVRKFYAKPPRPVFAKVTTPFDHEYALPVRPARDGSYPRRSLWYCVVEPFSPDGE